MKLVQAVETPGGTRRSGSVRVGDVGHVTRDSADDYVVVFWPARHVTTVEHLGRDVALVQEVKP